MRTSRLAIFIRACLLVFLIYLGLARLWNWGTGTAFWTVFEMAVSAVITVVLYGGIGWIGTNVLMALLSRNSSEYQRFRANGGDPYFDSLPPPINTDSEITRVTGLREPEYTSFVPPESWQFQCPCCGARVERRIDVCWNCRYGADGNSGAYFGRWGDQRPVDLTDDQWAEIRRKSKA
jgi:hypothetical protein